MNPNLSILDSQRSTDSDVLVRVEGVSKKFCRDLKKSLWYGVCDIAAELSPFGPRSAVPSSSLNQNQETKNNEQRTKNSTGGGNQEPRTRNQELSPDPSLRSGEFYAVRDVSFELRRGECLGLIGRNGAGKTTLLKMLNGLIKPDSGTITMRGRIGALIALGAGFNPILTGRENIYVNGAVLGLRKKEIDSKLDEIIDFAEIREFIDSPVQSYSSGMNVRLGFAVASTLDPDVLIIDEVLAVGDVGFRTKCYNRIYEICKKAAVIFVSHNMPQIDRLCSRAVVMDGGQNKFSGGTALAIDQYNRLFVTESRDWLIAEDVHVQMIAVNGESTKRSFRIEGNDPLRVEIEAEFPARVKHLEISVSFLEKSFELVSQANSRFDGQNLQAGTERKKIHISIPACRLGSGLKLMSVAIVDAQTNEILLWAHGSWELVVSNRVYVPSPSQVDATFNQI